MAEDFRTGQRWISESEPELGLGSVIRVTDRTVSVLFGASDAHREYARKTAPLRRVRFRVGDRIDGLSQVLSVREADGLIFYRVGRKELCETELSDAISFNKPEERLFAGQLDTLEAFNLRATAHDLQHRRRKSAIRGFVGGRIDLIPHQLYIASEVAGRLAPRVLLADEVGLGKTIEACLILHRLILTGRVSRVLILVPESLVHQWFVELLRRFNLWFHIFDEERCIAIEESGAGDNPFLDGQLLLCNIGLFTSNSRRTDQALEAGWDMLVVDEAHHLGWSPDAVSPEYTLVESLSRKTPGLLLLTATPEQLGIGSHFARLRLLDPDRFYDLDEFIKETGQYRDVAARAEALLDDPEQLDPLLDRHGTGRVSFRNTRTTISGFPRRIVRMHSLSARTGVRTEFDAAIDWLAGILLAPEPEKTLLICRTQAKVMAIDTALRQRIKNVRMAVFHEGLTLVQRDRNAAWFAETGGALILLCSEIGSEGRNFQFAHHLILFDLPLDPEVLEQRIGRLDRIGQTEEIQIHVPFVAGSSEEVLARWFHEGLDLFEHNLLGGRELMELLGDRVQAVVAKPNAGEVEKLIADTRQACQEITLRLRGGRDRLLELSSFRPAAAARLVDQIRLQDADTSLDDFMLAVFEHYSLQADQLAPRTYRLGSAGVFTDSFPGLTGSVVTVTCDRARALVREDVQFLTWDHPLVNGAIDLLLGSEKGNSNFALWPDSKVNGLYLETIFMLECPAPPGLQVDRFLPPTPLRVLVDHKGKEQTVQYRLENGDASALLEQPEIREVLLPSLLKKVHSIANARISGIVDEARLQMTTQLDREVVRLTELQKVNRSVRTEEINLLVEQRRSLEQHLNGARLRLDAIRLIRRGLRENAD